jgi:hypothetical protein
MDCEFIQDIETWGSGGHMMDIVTLKDGRILVIAEHGVVLYPSRAAFDSGANSTRIEVGSQRRTAGKSR